MKGVLVALLLLISIVISGPAFADEFDQILGSALKYYSEGDYDNAIEKFFEAKLLKDEPELVYNIARAYDKKGDCQAAQKHYSQFLARSDAPAETAKKAKSYLEALGECPTKGTLALACDPPSAQVQIDGNPMGPCGRYELEQGDRVLIISAPGYKPQDKKLTITAGQVEATTVNLEISEPAGGGIVDKDGPSTTNWLAIGTLSGGAALIVATVIVDQINLSGNAKELEKLPQGDPRRADFEDKFSTNQAIMYVTGGLGVAAIVAGTIFWAADIGASSESAALSTGDDFTWTLSPAVSHEGDVGAVLNLTF